MPIVFDDAAANEQLKEMKTSITPMGVRTLIWFFNKIFRHYIRGLFVD